ncbi:MAG TPA: glutamate 5-kinase [Deltaproteobacteria bacterium]|nr:glutamate 5-kinase [Deltaproteobacteria bacterium]HPR56223.1 glutamate 5-kinase [Deltaproteobacteria bacterium]HXK46200.1 glutamate 5-kinase [Deltaproteobacteria bacterium]
MKSGTRAGLKKCKRVLIKIGSQVLSTGHGLNNRVMERICDDVSLMRDRGREFAMVSSGAIAEGRAIMNIGDTKTALSKKQALAAIGQGSLMRAYTDAFRRYGYTAAQILITREDLDDRRRYLNIRNTFSSLFDMGAVPIINENDTVAVEEIQFTDNDMLAAMILPLVEAHILIILTDIEGVYSKDPKAHEDAAIIHEIPELRSKDLKVYGDGGNPLGRGGIRSKLEAAYRASMLGVPTIIASAYTPQVVTSILEGREIGTFVHPKKKAALTQKDHWLGFVSRPKGRVIVDDGAATMVLTRGKSLLPVGVVDVEGSFQAGDPVEIVQRDGEAIAVGLSNFATEEIIKIMGASTKDLAQILDYECDEEVVHRNNMILRKEIL